MSVSMVKNTGHARLLVVQGIKKKKQREREEKENHVQGKGVEVAAGGDEGNWIPRIQWVWMHREQDTTD